MIIYGKCLKGGEWLTYSSQSKGRRLQSLAQISFVFLTCWGFWLYLQSGGSVWLLIASPFPALIRLPVFLEEGVPPLLKGCEILASRSDANRVGAGSPRGRGRGVFASIPVVSIPARLLLEEIDGVLRRRKIAVPNLKAGKSCAFRKGAEVR